MKSVIGIAVLSGLLCASAQARDIEVDTVLICDSQGHAERVGTLLHGDAKNVLSAVGEVNAEGDSHDACSLLDAAFVRGTTLATIRANGDTFQIAPILLIGILEEKGLRTVPERVYFSVFKIHERMA